MCVSLLQDPCVVFSLGSNGDYSFEESILDTTSCTVHTFDCTVNGRNLSERHHYHKLCLGSAAKAAVDPNFITLEEAVSFVDKVSLLKIDIEGFEFDALASWKQMDTLLPEQVTIEVHHSYVIYMGTPSQNNAKDFSNLLCTFHEPVFLEKMILHCVQKFSKLALAVIFHSQLTLKGFSPCRANAQPGLI